MSFSEDYRARQLAALRDRRLRRHRRRAVGGRRRSRRCSRTSTSRGPSTPTWCSTRRRTSIARRRWSSATAAASTSPPAKRSRRPSCRTSCWPSPEAAQDNPLLRNDRVLFRDRLGAAASRSSSSRAFSSARAELRVCLLGETIIDEWVDVTVDQPVAEVALRGRPRNGAQPPDRRRRRHRAAPGQLRQGGRTASRTGWAGAAAGQRHGDARSPTSRWSRRGSSIRTTATGCSSRRARTCAACGATACPTSTTTTSC